MDRFKDLGQVQTPIWVYSFEQQSILWANSAALELWEAKDNQELSLRDLKSVMSQAVQATLETYRAKFESGDTIRSWWHISPNQNNKCLLCDFSGIETEDGQLAMLVHALSEEAQLRSDLAFAKGSNLSLLFDHHGHLISANDAFTQFSPFPIKHLSTLTGSEQRAEKWLSEVRQSRELNKEININIDQQLFCFQVTAHWLKQKQQLLLELTDTTKQKEQVLTAQFEANHDYLTGLYNRRGLLLQGDSWAKTHNSFHLVFIDLDGFKMINDTYGHAVGDSLLVAVTKRLQQHLSDAFAIARFGGDEFVALLPIQERLTERLLDINQQLSQSFKLNGSHNVSVNASIGCATFDAKDDTAVETAIQYATYAMHKAKEQGKNRYQIFTPQLAQAMVRRSLIRQHLSTAIANDQFSIHYQPIFCSNTGSLHGAEALLRWHDPKLGHISPAEFIPIAEDSGQIVSLGDWVVENALAQLHQWQSAYKRELVISINVSRIQLHSGFSQYLADLLEHYQVNPKQVAIELTESCMVYNMEEVKQWLSELSELGVKIYLDDFGTGYSSLSVLQQLPIDMVKLDKSFVQSDDESGLAIIQATSVICDKLDLQVVAEGIEDEGQKQLMHRYNYGFLQGFLFSRPIAADEFAARYLH